jgi:hypothetical protein
MATNRQPSAPPMNSWDLATKDEIVDEIHRWRESYASRFNFDLDRIFSELKSQEAKNHARRSTLRPIRPHAGKR